MNEIQIETALQNAAPSLPDALKAQTLRNCRLSVEARERKYRRTQRTLWGAVVAVCALHWLIVGQLDAQSAQWLNDGNAPAPVRVATDESAAPGAVMAFGWRGDMRERKWLLSSLAGESNDIAR
jgi:hypothetical protein